MGSRQHLNATPRGPRCRTCRGRCRGERRSCSDATAVDVPVDRLHHRGGKIMRKPLLSALAIAACASIGTASAAETWNMASGYPDNNYHTQNVRMFLEDLTAAQRRQARGRAAQQPVTGQASGNQAGRANRPGATGRHSLASVQQRRPDSRGLVDPLLCRQHRQGGQALEHHQAHRRRAAGRTGHPAALWRPLAVPGLLHQGTDQRGERSGRREVPGLQQVHRADGRGARRPPDAGRVQ